MLRLQLTRRQIPIAIALLYAVLGAAWILFSDGLLLSIGGLTNAQLVRYSMTKGLAYVGLTTLLIWWLVWRALEAVAKAEAARSESESRYRQVFEETRSVCLLIDVETLQLVDVNPSAVQFYGWSREELMRKRISEINTMPEAKARDLVANAGRQRRTFVSTHRLRSGATRDVEVHSSAFVLNDRPTVFAIVHDITERLGAERALVESEANYRRALEQASDAIIVSDRQGVILAANARAEEILDHPREQIVGRGLDDFLAVPERERPPLPDLIGGRSVLSERRVKRTGGGFADVEISTRDLGDGRIQAIVRDISERRRLEEQLRQAQKMEAVGQLTGGIAHDLNNLLTVVLANSEVMGASLPEGRDDLRTDLGELQTAARRGAQMIRKLLSFSRHAPLTYAVFDLGLLLNDLSGTMRRLLPAHIAVDVTLEEAPVRVLADAGAIEQIVLNLATNARDAMPRGGRLTLDARRVDIVQTPGGGLPGGYARLTVTDSGVGMEERVKARVFEPFFTTKSPTEGTGLGMAMIYGLTQQHGGFVELESAVGVGTTVRVFLPLAGEDQPPAEFSLTPTGLHGGNEHILLVEDEDGLRRVAQRALEKLGYTVLTAVDGLEALAVYHGNADSIDLVITDVVMPRLGGIALHRTLRQEGHNVRFLFTSGYSAQEIMQGDLGSEQMVLEKPWALADLTSRVREVLDRAQKDGA